MTDLKSTSMAQPGLFVAHGAPDLVLSDIPARRFLQTIVHAFPEPRAIVVISAHWSSNTLQMTGPTALETIHDYYGWQEELYDVTYPAQGAEWLNHRLITALGEAGYKATVNTHRGLDHGAWVPLLLMYPKGDIPVVQLSLTHGALPETHFRVGQALESLRGEGVLVLGSGGVVHNLWRLHAEGSPPEDWASSFDEGLYQKLQSRDLADIFRFVHDSEFAKVAHPTTEHLMPLFVAMGAGWSEGKVQRIHHSFSYGNVSMASYAFTHHHLNDVEVKRPVLASVSGHM